MGVFYILVCFGLLSFGFLFDVPFNVYYVLVFLCFLLFFIQVKFSTLQFLFGLLSLIGKAGDC